MWTNKGSGRTIFNREDPCSSRMWRKFSPLDSEIMSWDRDSELGYFTKDAHDIVDTGRYYALWASVLHKRLSPIKMLSRSRIILSRFRVSDAHTHEQCAHAHTVRLAAIPGTRIKIKTAFPYE